MKSFTKFELGLWAVSVSVVTASFIIGGNFRVLTLIARLSLKKTIMLCITAVIVTVIFYFILRYFNNAYLFFSTISITTSFLASALMLFRSSAYALAYGANDIILIILWVMASLEDTAYLPMVMCFAMFLANDIYGFYSWQKRKKLQEEKRLCLEK